MGQIIKPLTKKILSNVFDQGNIRDKYPIFDTHIETLAGDKHFITTIVEGALINGEVQFKPEHVETLRVLDRYAPDGMAVAYVRIAGREGLLKALTNLAAPRIIIFYTEHREVWEQMFRVLNVQAPDSKFFAPLFKPTH